MAIRHLMYMNYGTANRLPLDRIPIRIHLSVNIPSPMKLKYGTILDRKELILETQCRYTRRLHLRSMSEVT